MKAFAFTSIQSAVWFSLPRATTMTSVGDSSTDAWASMLIRPVLEEGNRPKGSRGLVLAATPQFRSGSSMAPVCRGAAVECSWQGESSKQHVCLVGGAGGLEMPVSQPV